MSAVQAVAGIDQQNFGRCERPHRISIIDSVLVWPLQKLWRPKIAQLSCSMSTRPNGIKLISAVCHSVELMPRIGSIVFELKQHSNHEMYQKSLSLSLNSRNSYTRPVQFASFTRRSSQRSRKNKFPNKAVAMFPAMFRWCLMFEKKSNTLLVINDDDEQNVTNSIANPSSLRFFT